jgi:hypothetical protein
VRSLTFTPFGYIQGYKLPSYLLSYPNHSKKYSHAHSSLLHAGCLVVLHLGGRRGFLKVLRRCGWHLQLELVDLLEKVSDLKHPLLKLGALLLDLVL